MLQPKYPLISGIEESVDNPGYASKNNEKIEIIRDGINTLASEANQTYPLISSGAGAPTSTPYKIGDKYMDLTNDVIYTAYGNASSADWKTSSGGSTGLKMGWASIEGTITISANHMHATRCVAPYSTTINHLTLVVNGSTAGIKITVGVYADNGTNTPQAKLVQSGESTSILNEGRQLLFTFVSPLSIVSGTYYWLVFHADGGIDIPIAYNYVGSVSGQVYRDIAYNSTLPATFGAITGNSGGHLCMESF